MDGVLAGTVKVKGVPVASGTAILFTEENDTKIATVALDAEGKFSFPGLDKSKLYYIVVKQNDTTWEHIVSSRRIPV